MLAFWTLFTILILFLAGCASFLILQARVVAMRERLFREALWKRRHKIPLLLEICAATPEHAKLRSELISLRERASCAGNSTASLREIEGAISHVIDEVVRRNRTQENGGLSAQSLALECSMKESRDAINIRLNDYNFATAQWHRYTKLPWLRIFTFAFDFGSFLPLPPV